MSHSLRRSHHERGIFKGSCYCLLGSFICFILLFIFISFGCLWLNALSVDMNSVFSEDVWSLWLKLCGSCRGVFALPPHSFCSGSGGGKKRTHAKFPERNTSKSSEHSPRWSWIDPIARWISPENHKGYSLMGRKHVSLILNAVFVFTAKSN